MSDEELIPRPEQSPEGLRKALSAVAPDRLSEMAAALDAAVSAALEEGAVTPLRAWRAQEGRTEFGGLGRS